MLPQDRDSKSSTSDSDRELALLVRANDKSAFHALYLRHVTATYRYALSIVRVEHDAEEVTQETWLTFWNSRGRIELATTSALPWLLVTARHLALRQLRGNGRRMKREGIAEHPRYGEDPGVVLESGELKRFIQSLVDEMAPIDRQLFTMCVTDNVSYRDASESLGVTEGSIRNRVHRLRKRLRDSVVEREGQP